MDTPAKTLYILRHAKSDWHSDAPDDFSRPLNKRGEKDVPRMGQWMRHQGYIPEFIVSSPAMRARQTAMGVCEAMHIDPDSIEYNKQLYLADVHTLGDVVRRTSRQKNSLLLVGHNPGLEDLVRFLLADNTPDFADGKVLPTATLYVIQLDDWASLRNGCGKLSQMMRPKQLSKEG